MGKILEKLMKKYWKNAKKTGKVREIRQSKKVGTMSLLESSKKCFTQTFGYCCYIPTSDNHVMT